MSSPLLHTHTLYLRIDPGRIHFLRFILEGYDGLAILSTVDARGGLVLIRYPDMNAPVLFELLGDLAERLSK